jgi:5-(carboxyamino)imidazole ribonucleotide synthase
MRIGILGAGQLGRMLALAGYPLGHSFSFFDVSEGAPCKGLGAITVGSFEDHTALENFAKHCDVVTYEFENVPCDAARHLANFVPVYPPPRALEVSQDRLVEKEFLQGLGVATPRFKAANSEADLRDACDTLGLPCMVKTRRLGYDGKGQRMLESEDDIARAWRDLGDSPLIVEGFVPFSRELSVIAVRAQDGTLLTYPLAQNDHRNGILHRSEIPAPDVTPELRSAAHDIAKAVLDDLEYVGVIGIELFHVRGELLANEIAPRVHNSGHATIDGIVTSQFENHIRAITGMPLGSVEPHARAVMFNLIGTIPPLEALSGITNAKLHLYGKSPRPGRKLGHVTLLNPSAQDEQKIEALLP